MADDQVRAVMRPRESVCRAFAVLAFLLCLAPTSAQAKSGQLDSTFGQTGLAFASLDTTFSGAEIELASASDGSAVLAANGGDLVRFDANGYPDPEFGEGGKLPLGPDTVSEGVEELSFLPHRIAADSRGRLLVFGQQTDTRQTYFLGGFTGSVPKSSAMVLRFTAEGKPDPSFGEGKGFIRGSFGLGPGLLRAKVPMVSALTGRADSKDRPVFVAGVTSQVSGCYSKPTVDSLPRAVVRLTESGLIDHSFGGGDGLSPIEGSTSFPRLGIDGADGPLIGVGPIGGERPECRFGTTVIRMRQNGKRVGGFGVDGARAFKRLDLSVVEPSGATILSFRDGSTHVALARLRPDGSRDMKFGRDGLARVGLPSRVGSHLWPVAVDARGRILLVGFIGSVIASPPKGQPRHSAVIVSRLLPNGKPDPGFGSHGRILTWFARPLELNSAKGALDPQGRLLVAGTVTAPDSEGGYVLARYLLEP